MIHYFQPQFPADTSIAPGPGDLGGDCTLETEFWVELPKRIAVFSGLAIFSGKQTS